MPTRESVRVLMLDQHDRVLLVRFRDGDKSWWCTPGGGIEPGETGQEAAARELREEVGLALVRIGPLIWTRRHQGTLRGRPFDQSERIYLAHVEAFEPRPRAVEHPEHAAEDIRWWTLDELHSTGEDLTPRDIAHRVRSLLEDGPPPRPIRVGR